jgi:hypothetical protein
VGNAVAEKNTFAAFLNAAPDFANEAVQNWCQPKQDPPDVLCATGSGRQVGLELTGWIDEGQIADAKSTESIEQSIRRAIQPEPPNNTEHIHFVWLMALPKARISLSMPAHSGRSCCNWSIKSTADGVPRKLGIHRRDAGGRTLAVTRQLENI